MQMQSYVQSKKTRKLTQIFFLGLLASAVQSSFAAPPVAFDKWSQGKNGLSSNCPSNFTCSEGISDQGMLQRTLTDANGKRFYQTVIYDKMADGTTLSSESFVRGNNVGDGISTKQVLTATGSTSISSESVIDSGWATSSGSGSVTRLNQQLSDNSHQGIGYTDSFIFESTQDSNENTTGYYLDIRQEVSDSSGVTPPSGSIIEGNLSGPSSGQDKHVFVTRKASGIYVPGSGSASLPSPSGMGGMMGSGGSPTGGSVSWGAGDEVQVLWIGQVCEGCQNAGDMMGGGGGGMGGGGGGGGGGGNAVYSYQAYSNLSDSSTAATQSLNSTSPVNWNSSVFGAKPQF
ncbi:MAG: hypothetical protein OEX19_05020 [Gammaproteobacteria bacterium]|nr:hypothetical protein [Gammaproteobacteria bacterium]